MTSDDIIPFVTSISKNHVDMTNTRLTVTLFVITIYRNASQCITYLPTRCLRNDTPSNTIICTLMLVIYLPPRRCILTALLSYIAKTYLTERRPCICSCRTKLMIRWSDAMPRSIGRSDGSKLTFSKLKTKTNNAKTTWWRSNTQVWRQRLQSLCEMLDE